MNLEEIVNLATVVGGWIRREFENQQDFFTNLSSIPVGPPPTTTCVRNVILFSINFPYPDNIPHEVISRFPLAIGLGMQLTRCLFDQCH